MSATTTESAGKDTTLSRGRMINKITVLSLNLLVVALIAVLAYLVWLRINGYSPITSSQSASSEIKEASSEGGSNLATSSSLPEPISSGPQEGVFRKASLLTIIPERPGVEILTYTVKTGDTLFTIAEQFKIKPTTLLWGNFETLEDNPHLLKPGQVLNVLPVDGTYYQWQKNDSLESVATYFHTTTDAIASFTGNQIDLTTINQENSGIESGQWVVVPDGRRAIKDWGPPAISRSNPASAKSYGPGACEAVYEGAVGTQSFLWPTTERFISGFAFDPGLHPALDIAGQIGNAIYAADSGVVVYAGWSDYGYGYLIVIDHGFGWQTAYAHLSAVGVSCGQSVFRGGLIGGLGSSGNSTGAHLHFELVYNGAKLNPMDFLQ